MLFSTKGIGEFISGAILFEETLFDKTQDGKRQLVDLLRDQGIILGIKVDLGTKSLLGTDNELYTQGLTDLDKRCEKYYKAGARFAKW
jgi:fructose-bisphosphate aldolase class I